MKGLRRNLLLLVASVAAVLFLSELVLRLFFPVRFSVEVQYEPDTHLGIRPVPDQQYALREGGTCSINNLGFRGARDTAWEKRPGSVRVVVLGGSSTFCYHTSDENVWTVLLEERLRERYGRDVEVVNAGVPGYSVFESKINYMYRLRPLDPDIVLVYHTWNDMKFYRAVEEKRVALRGGYRTSPLRTWARRTQLGWRVRNFLHANVKPRQRENIVEASDDADLPRPGGRAHRWERRNYDDLALLLARDGVLPVFASQASLLSDSSVARADVRAMSYIEFVGFSFAETVAQWEATSRIIEDVSREHGIPFLDVRASVPARPEYFSDHVHLTVPGNALVAEVVARGFAATAVIDSVMRAAD